MILPSRSYNAEDVSQHYNELDPLYRAIWGEHIHHGLWSEGDESKDEAVRNLVHYVSQTAALNSGQMVCDVGCGYGATAQMLAEEFNADVTGLTVSPRQWMRARRRKTRRGALRFALMDWLENTLPCEAFDVVIAIESSEHMIDKARFMAEAHRVLKPGGCLVICAWLASEDSAVWEQEWLLRPICNEGRLPGLLTGDEYRSLFIGAGFSAPEMQDLSPYVKRTWSLCITQTLRHFLRHPVDLRYLLPRFNSNHDFARSLFRIRLAYETGAMEYGILKARKRLH